MYSVPLPVSAIRTRIRQEFERHRFANKLPVVDVLIGQSNADYQVSSFASATRTIWSEEEDEQKSEGNCWAMKEQELISVF